MKPEAPSSTLEDTKSRPINTFSPTSLGSFPAHLAGCFGKQDTEPDALLELVLQGQPDVRTLLGSLRFNPRQDLRPSDLERRKTPPARCRQPHPLTLREKGEPKRDPALPLSSKTTGFISYHRPGICSPSHRRNRSPALPDSEWQKAGKVETLTATSTNHITHGEEEAWLAEVQTRIVGRTVRA